MNNPNNPLPLKTSFLLEYSIEEEPVCRAARQFAILGDKAPKSWLSMVRLNLRAALRITRRLDYPHQQAR
jgi:hypothetical protein